jgi:hypothetical protein
MRFYCRPKPFDRYMMSLTLLSCGKKIGGRCRKRLTNLRSFVLPSHIGSAWGVALFSTAARISNFAPLEDD